MLLLDALQIVVLASIAICAIALAAPQWKSIFGWMIAVAIVACAFYNAFGMWCEKYLKANKEHQ